jgi:hypothetical protein
MLQSIEASRSRSLDVKAPRRFEAERTPYRQRYLAIIYHRKLHLLFSNANTHEGRLLVHEVDVLRHICTLLFYNFWVRSLILQQ